MTFFFPKSLLSISVFYRYFRKSSLFPRVILVNAYHYGIFKLTVSPQKKELVDVEALTIFW
jgi:hypothetical protein